MTVLPQANPTADYVNAPLALHQNSFNNDNCAVRFSLSVEATYTYLVQNHKKNIHREALWSQNPHMSAVIPFSL